MDQSVTPCGQPCWYRVEGVSHITINDLFMLEGAIYFLLKKHFRTEPYHVHFLELFHDVSPRLRCFRCGADANGARRRRSRQSSGSSLT